MARIIIFMNVTRLPEMMSSISTTVRVSGQHRVFFVHFSDVSAVKHVTITKLCIWQSQGGMKLKGNGEKR